MKMSKHILSLKMIYDKFRVIEKEVNDLLSLPLKIVRTKANKKASKGILSERNRYNRLCAIEKEAKDLRSAIAAIIAFFYDRICNKIKKEKEKIIRANFLIYPFYKCKKEYCEVGTHAYSINKNEIIKICGVDFHDGEYYSEYLVDHLYVDAKKVRSNYHHEYGIPYKDLLESFDGISSFKK